jgi:hypothetical protein
MSTPRAIRAARRSVMLPPEPPEDIEVDDIEPDLVTDDDYPDTEQDDDDEQPA